MTPGSPYRLDYSGSIRDQVRLLLRRAMEKGVIARVRLAIQQIEGHLELHPTTWGDISHHLRKLQISVYNRIHDELSVTYGVHDAERVVWLTRIAPILGHPLCEQGDE